MKGNSRKRFGQLGIGGMETFVLVNFFVRTRGEDIKFRTEDLAMEIACLSNKSNKEVVAIVVKKIKTITYKGGKLHDKVVQELPKSKQLFEVYLKTGYKTLSGKVI